MPVVLDAIHLEISIGVMGEIKNTDIKNPTWEQIEASVSQLNGWDRRNVSLSDYRDKAKFKFIQIVGGLAFTQSSQRFLRGVIYFADFMNPQIMEVIDTLSSDQQIVRVEKYVQGNNLRPFNQTIPIEMGVQVFRDFWNNEDLREKYTWTSKRWYGG